MAKVFGSSKFRNCSIGECIDAHLSPIIANIDSDYGPHSKNQDDIIETDDLDDAADDSFETTDDLSSTNAKNDSVDTSHIEPQESDDFTDLGIIYVNGSNALDIELQKIITYFNSDDDTPPRSHFISGLKSRVLK